MVSQPDTQRQTQADDGETVGLLFVHGIGQQKPFDHLTTSVSEIAELLKRDGQTICTVLDRTPDWKFVPGTTTAMGEAPVTLITRKAGRTTRFECHEVYWADLGARDGIVDTVSFWFWGLGQWAAPIYREFDAAQLTKSDKDASGAKLNRQASKLARLPPSIAGDPPTEIKVRLQLALAGLAALLTLVSWSLLKRIFAAVFKAAPGPSLLVQYVGDVRTYEESARPGDTALSDPGFPRRVGIRRRMVTQMVAMGDRVAKGHYKRWYVLGHSLGSVLTYNGLTEIGHTLPNYLGKTQWEGLHGDLKVDEHCNRRGDDELAFMMPGRPDWLKPEDVINRRKLFEGLSGILTYGSPLNKFAALWPRIVATATDRQVGDYAFPQGGLCQWINLRAPLDPVSGDLDRFGAANMKPDGTGIPSAFTLLPFKGFIPEPRTYTTPFWQPYLQAHLDYFRNQSPFARGYAIEHRMQLAQWLIDPKQTITAIPPLGPDGRLGMLGAALGIVLALLGLTTLMVTLAGGIGMRLFTATATVPFSLTRFAGNILPVLVVLLACVLSTGLLRWWKESRFNRQMALIAANKTDRPEGLRQTSQGGGVEGAKVSDEIDKQNQRQLLLHNRQFGSACLMIVMLLPVLCVVAAWLSGHSSLVIGQVQRLIAAFIPALPACWLPTVTLAILVLAELALGLLAMTLQAVVNTTVPPLKPEPTASSS